MSMLNLFPARVPIGKIVADDGSEIDVLASIEFLKALKVLFDRVGGSSSSTDMTSLAIFAALADTPSVEQSAPVFDSFTQQSQEAVSLQAIDVMMAQDVNGAAISELSKQVEELRLMVVALSGSASDVGEVRKYAQDMEVLYSFSASASSGIDWEHPGKIGASTPNTGVFTTVNKITFTQPAVSATFTLATGKTFTVSNTLTLTATDGSTLAIGTGGTLGTAAYTASSTYALLAGSSSQAFSTSTLTASNIITATRTSAGATIEVMSLKNAGSGGSTKAELAYYAAGTKYASLVGGYGAAAPEWTVDISAVTQLKVATAGVTVTTGFGCNAKTPQTAYVSGGALNAYGAGANGLDTGANMSALHAMVVSIRAALVADGIMS